MLSNVQIQKELPIRYLVPTYAYSENSKYVTMNCYLLNYSHVIALARLGRGIHTCIYMCVCVCLLQDISYEASVEFFTKMWKSAVDENAFGESAVESPRKGKCGESPTYYLLVGTPKDQARAGLGLALFGRST